MVVVRALQILEVGLGGVVEVRRHAHAAVDIRLCSGAVIHGVLVRIEQVARAADVGEIGRQLRGDVAETLILATARSRCSLLQELRIQRA